MNCVIRPTILAVIVVSIVACMVAAAMDGGVDVSASAGADGSADAQASGGANVDEDSVRVAGIVDIRGDNVSVPGVVVTAGQVRITPAVLRSKIAQEAEIDLDQLIIDLGADVVITPGLIKMGDSTVESDGKKATVSINGRDIEVSTQSSHVQIKDGDVEVETESVTVARGQLKVDDVAIQAPGVAISAAARAGANKISLVKEQGKPVYRVDAEKKGRLFFVLPVNLDTETTIDAQTGATVDVKGPWWAFLASAE